MSRASFVSNGQCMCFMDDYGYPVPVRWFPLAVFLNSAGGY